MGIFAGKILRTGDDADREHGGDGYRSLHGPVDRQASAAEERCVHPRRGLSHPAETRADRGAGAALCLFDHLLSRHVVHRGNLCGGIVCRRPANHSRSGSRSRNPAADARHFVPAAEFPEFQRDGCRGARTRRSGSDYLACDVVRHRVHRHRADGCRGRIFAAKFEMSKRARNGLLLGAALLAGFVGVWKLQERVDAERTALRLEADELTLRSPGVMKKLSLEYAPLMGAIYWTRAVQYYGQKHHLGDQNLELLWPLLDISSTLDPNLIVAYRFGATFLSDAPPRGAGEPEKAVELLERGIKANPEYWRFYQDLGDVYYFDEKNYLKASQAFEEGSRNPAALPWMKTMAPKIAPEGATLQTSYPFLLDVYHPSPKQDMRKNAENHPRLVQAGMDIRGIHKSADVYEKGTKRRATRISELVQAGVASGEPTRPR